MKKKSFLIIIVCILFLTGCGCQKKEESPGANNSNKVEESNNNSNGTSNIENNSSNGTASNSNSNSNNNVQEKKYNLSSDEKTKINLLLSVLKPKSLKMNFNSFNNNEKVRIVIELMSKNYLQKYNKKTIKNPEKLFTKKNVIDTLHEYFGPEATMNLTDYYCESCKISVYNYDKNKEAYVPNKKNTEAVKKKVYLFTQSKGSFIKGNVIKVKYLTIFSDIINLSQKNDFPKRFYSTYSNAQKKKSPVVTDSSKYCKIKNGIKKFSCNFVKMAKEKKFYTYVYNFEKKGNELYFVGYEVEV